MKILVFLVLALIISITKNAKLLLKYILALVLFNLNHTRKYAHPPL